MKQLSKIIFINSAKTDYGEVRLDGNVHFTGTQGVGKSSLLRAVLFFYNADKSHLGIRQQGQKPFDDFYLPTPASYLIYEVSTGADAAFTVMVFRHRGRAAYRFVDAPFDKEWVISADGVVAADPLTVRSLIPSGISMSPIIERYEQYRDIIYGNRQGRIKAELYKYNILESPQYRNIPKIITNVFLNERVDADFIKDTIIKAISDEDDAYFNLDYFRGELANFTEEYNDVRLWSTCNRHGRCETADRADAMIEKLQRLQADRLSLRTCCGELVFAMKDTEERIPGLRKKIDDANRKLLAVKNRISDLERKHTDRRDKLVGEIRVFADKLAECRKKRRRYREQNIDAVELLMATEDDVKAMLEQSRNERTLLESNYSDITAYYKTLIDGIKLQAGQYGQTRRRELLDREAAYYAAVGEIAGDQAKAKKEIDDDFAMRIENARQDVRNGVTYVHELELRDLRIKASKPGQKEIDDVAGMLSELRMKELALDKGISETEAELTRISFETEQALRNTESETKERLRPVWDAIRSVDEKTEAEKSLLERADGSLCQWLDANMEGWEDSIGKVADEGTVLYSTVLSPKKSKGGTVSSLFGVDIDLDALERKVRTKDEIEASLKALEESRAVRMKEAAGIEADGRAAIEKIESKANARAKALQQQSGIDRQSVLIVQTQIKNTELRLDKLQKQQKEAIEMSLKENSKAIEDAQRELDRRRCAQDKLDDDKKKLLNAIERKFSTKEKEARHALDDFKKIIDDSIKASESERDEKIARLEKEKANKLIDAGADTGLIGECAARIAALEMTLAEIDSRRQLHFEYQKDCRDFLDKEPEFTLKHEKLKGALGSVEDSYKLSHGKLLADAEALRENIGWLEEDLRGKTDGLEHAKEFCDSPLCPEFFGELRAINSKESCKALLNKISEFMQAAMRETNELKECVNAFRQPFSSRNTFKFPTALSSDDDFVAYALSVYDFVAENKIKHFRELTNSIYVQLLDRTQSDYAILTARESQIRKLILDMNNDFERKTFAGVIKKIELKADPSHDPLAVLLKEIADFRNANPFAGDELNLFSLEENNADVNKKVLEYIRRLSDVLSKDDREKLTLSDTFALKFNIIENDNNLGWRDNIKEVGSDGTDILVKAIINILLISVFKNRTRLRSNDFRIHCMMDEIGKLADENIEGILKFANERNILIVNSSPKAHRPLLYKRLYLLSKDERSRTVIRPILSTRQSEMI